MISNRDAIVLALEKRGETRIEDKSLSKWWRYTRRFTVMRGLHGQLLPARAEGVFFYVNRSVGQVRIGRTSTGSIPMDKSMLQILINEGREHAQRPDQA